MAMASTPLRALRSPLGASVWSLCLALLVALCVTMLPPLVVGGALIGSALFVLFLTRPHYGLYLLALSVPFQSLKTLDVAGLNLSATEVIVALTALSWLARLLVLKTSELRPAPLTVPLLIFLAAIFLSFLQAQDLLLSFKELIKWLELFVVYLLAVNLLEDRRQLQILVVLLLGAASIEAMYGLFQFATRRGPPSFLIQGRFMRAYGTFDQPNPFAGYLNLLLPLALACGLVAMTPKSTGGDVASGAVDTRYRLAWWLVVALLGFAVLVTLSRGAWIALATATLLLGIRARLVSQRTLGIAACLCICVAWLAAVGLLPESILTAALRSFSLADVDTNIQHLTPQTFSAAQRLAYWIAGWNMFSDHPWLGVGMGNYGVYYAQYAVQGWETQLAHAHDYYLNLAAETGMIGLAAFLVFTVAALWQMWIPAFRLRDPFLSALVAGTLGMLVTLSVHNLFDDLFVHGTVNIVAVMLGAAAVARRIDSSLALGKKVEKRPALACSRTDDSSAPEHQG